MVTGIETFREKFSGFENMYTLIGGAACDLIMDDVGLDFRATKDFSLSKLSMLNLAEHFGSSSKMEDIRSEKKATVNLNFIGFKSPQT